MKIQVVFRTFKASHTRVPAMSLSLPSPMGPKQVSHGPTWLHIALQNLQNWFVDKSQNLQNWNPEIWNIFPQNLQNWFVDRYITKKGPYGPTWLHMALFIMALLSILELNLTEDFSFEFTFSSDAFLVLHSDRLVTQVHMATHGYTWANMAPWPRKTYRIES